jgi:hypothetical protein
MFSFSQNKQLLTVFFQSEPFYDLLQLPIPSLAYLIAKVRRQLQGLTLQIGHARLKTEKEGIVRETSPLIMVL